MLTHRVGPPFCNFNPRLPRGRRRCGLPQRHPCGHISIHASLAGGDADGRDLHCTYSISIHASLAGGDQFSSETEAFEYISIHASLAGGDQILAHGQLGLEHFNPRLPRGRRRSRLCRTSCRSLFQSTSPSREATADVRRAGREIFISIHVSLAGGDGNRGKIGREPEHFNPRLPRGRRRLLPRRRSDLLNFNPRLPRGRRLQGVWKRIYVVEISIHVSLAGGDAAADSS